MPPRRKTVLITGASTGLGLALTRRLLRDDDMHLVLTARESSLGRFEAAGIREGERVWLRPLDVRDDHAAVARVVERTLRRRWPPLRVAGTPDAWLFGALRRWMPRRLYHAFLYRMLPNIRGWGPRAKLPPQREET